MLQLREADILATKTTTMALLAVILLSVVTSVGGGLLGRGAMERQTIRVTSVLIEPYLMLSPSHNSSRGNARYTGYIPDLLSKLTKIMGVDYALHEVRDGSFGYLQKEGHWDGMVGELMSKDADMAAAPMYSTLHRAKVIDFTDPFMEVTATLLLRKPPKAAELKIHEARDLLMQSEIQYGTLDTGVIIRGFKTSNDTVHRMLWRNMQRFKPKAFTTTNEEGIERVRKEKYAYIIPSTIGEYIAMREPCDLITRHRFLMKRGYSLALQKDSDLLSEVNKALYIMMDIGDLDSLYRKWWVDRSQCNGISHKRYSGVISGGGQDTAASLTLLIVMLVMATWST